MMNNPSFDQWWVSVHGWNWKANLSEETRDCAKEAWDAATIIQTMNKKSYLGFDVEDSSAYFDTSIEDQAISCLSELLECAENYMKHEEVSEALLREVIKEAKEIVQKWNDARKSK